MAKPIKNLYVPDSIPEDYNLLIPSSDGGYFDLYNKKYIEPGENVKFYRFFYNLDSDMYQNFDRTNNTSSRVSIGSEIKVTLTNNYIYRKDFKDILLVSSIYIIFILALVDIITSLVKKGGVFGAFFK